MLLLVPLKRILLLWWFVRLSGRALLCPWWNSWWL